MVIVFAMAAPRAYASWNPWNFMFSNKAYASNLTVQSIVVTKDRLCELIQDTGDTLESFPPETNGDLAKKESYIFIRIRNTGNMAAWGELHVEINNHKYEIDVPWIGAMHSSWHHIIVFVEGIFPRRDSAGPEIKLQWAGLYAK